MFPIYFRVQGIDYDYSQSDPSTPDPARTLPKARTIVFDVLPYIFRLRESIATIPKMIRAFPIFPDFPEFVRTLPKAKYAVSKESIATIPEMIRALPTFPDFARTLPEPKTTVFGIFPYIFGCRESITTIPETIRVLPIFPELSRSLKPPYEESIATVPVAIRDLPNLTTALIATSDRLSASTIFSKREDAWPQATPWAAKLPHWQRSCQLEVVYEYKQLTSKYCSVLALNFFEIIDVTNHISSFVSNCRVSDEVSSPTQETYRNPRKTDWEAYKTDLENSLTRMTQTIRDTIDLEVAAEQVQDAITSAYNDNCPITRKGSNRTVPWWNEDLSRIRRTVGKKFNKAKTNGEWDEYRRSLTEYNKTLRKSKRDSWRRHCEEIEGTPEYARLHKILSKGPQSSIYTLKTDSGEYTKTGRETIVELLRIQFPGSQITNLTLEDCRNIQGDPLRMETPL
ncbi:hypothetical protein NQ317_005248 [Molorchus minor]|uniref:Uncharacterized protein n=1 Tax=Molorchus minor TaxID=1323400 RepID=A0ABQ9JHV7_9CUCU|nr:hypothetical protein NQ317_005248 [Molorchus minor]